MKITICIDSFKKMNTSDYLVEKAYHVHSNEETLTDSEYSNLKEIISEMCGLPNEEDYEVDRDTGYWTCVYTEDDIPIYE